MPPTAISVSTIKTTPDVSTPVPHNITSPLPPLPLPSPQVSQPFLFKASMTNPTITPTLLHPFLQLFLLISPLNTSPRPPYPFISSLTFSSFSSSLSFSPLSYLPCRPPPPTSSPALQQLLGHISLLCCPFSAPHAPPVSYSPS